MTLRVKYFLSEHFMPENKILSQVRWNNTVTSQNIFSDSCDQM